MYSVYFYRFALSTRLMYTWNFAHTIFPPLRTDFGCTEQTSGKAGPASSPTGRGVDFAFCGYSTRSSAG